MLAAKSVGGDTGPQRTWSPRESTEGSKGRGTEMGRPGITRNIPEIQKEDTECASIGDVWHSGAPIDAGQSLAMHRSLERALFGGLRLTFGARR